MKTKVGRFINRMCPVCREDRLKTALGARKEGDDKEPEIVLYCQNCHYTEAR